MWLIKQAILISMFSELSGRVVDMDAIVVNTLLMVFFYLSVFLSSCISLSFFRHVFLCLSACICLSFFRHVFVCLSACICLSFFRHVFVCLSFVMYSSVFRHVFVCLSFGMYLCLFFDWRILIFKHLFRMMLQIKYMFVCFTIILCYISLSLWVQQYFCNIFLVTLSINFNNECDIWS
jgi:hypothetical protein